MKPQYLIIIIIILTILFTACSNDDSDRVYEEIDLYELDDLLGQTKLEFEKQYEHFYVEEYGALPYYGFETEHGVYQFYTQGLNDYSDNWVIAFVYADCMEEESGEEAIERMRRIAKLHFNDLPYYAPSDFSNGFVLGEQYKASDLDDLYDQAIEDGLSNIFHRYPTEDCVYDLSLRDGKVFIAISEIVFDMK